jgi:hypothetical protein
MKIWLILYVGNHIGGTIGPLPYDMNECYVRRDIQQSIFNKMIKTRIGENGITIPDNILEKIKSYHFECEEHSSRPIIE